MRPDQGSLNSFSTMAENGDMILRHILEAPYPQSSNVSIPPPSEWYLNIQVLTIAAFVFLPSENTSY